MTLRRVTLARGAAAALITALASAFLAAYPFSPALAERLPQIAAGAAAPLPATTITAAECTVERIGSSIPVTGIGEPVSAVTLAAPTWTEAASNAPAYCRVNGSMAPVDASSTAKPIDFAVVLPSRSAVAR